MDREEQRERLSDAEFKRLFGVKKETYEAMRLILEKEYAVLHQAGGCPPKLSVADKLQIALQYLREYRTMEHIGFDWGVKKSTVSESIRWAEDTLVKEGTFRLPGKKALRESGGTIEYIAADVTESPIERPKKNSENSTVERKSGTR